MSKGAGQLKCPITQAPLDDPVKSVACGHTYSRAAILVFIKKKRGKCPCPVAGCAAEVTADGLEADVEAVRAMAKAKQGQKRKGKSALDVE